MSPHQRMLISAVIVFMMMVTAVPFLQSEGAEDPIPQVSIADRGNGIYAVENPLLEQYFGVSADPYDLGDPMDSDLYRIIPMEIVVPGDGNSVVLNPSDGKTIGADDWGSMPMGRDQGNLVSSYYAALSSNSDVNRTNTDWLISFKLDWSNPVDDWDIDVQVSASNSLVTSSVLTLDDSAIDSYYSITELNNFIDIYNKMDLQNIISWTRGDFDGDGNEEVAMTFGETLYVLGLEVSGNNQVQLVVEAQYDLVKPEGLYINMYASSMSAIDTDDDGKDELLIARGYNGYREYPYLAQLSTMHLLDVVDGSMVTYMPEFMDVNGHTLNTIMLSVTDADVDGDGMPEIVIGGYLWDNTDAGTQIDDYTHNWKYHAGELFLAWAEVSDYLAGNPDFKMTVLGDDNGTAANRNAGDKHFSLHSHDTADTSAYFDSRSKSVNWINWTLPLQGIRMTSFAEGGLTQQVFFDNWFYQWDGSNFAVFQKTQSFTSGTPDNNNVLFTYLEAGIIWSDSPDDYDGRQSLFLAYSCDLESHYHDGDTENSFVIYDKGDGDYAKKTQASDLGITTFYEDWGSGKVGYCYLVNWDNDAYYAELQGQLYTYTDPTVVAVISAIPYDCDLADTVVGGPDGIGTTEFEKYTESGTGVESSSTISVGPSGSLEAWRFEIEGELGITNGWSSSHTQTIEYSTGYESAEDTVALYVIPVDILIYKVYQSDGNGGVRVSLQTLTFYHEAVDIILEYEAYEELIVTYNKVMSRFSDDYKELPLADPLNHEQGNIASYTEEPENPLASVNVTYFGSGPNSSVSHGIDLSTEDEESVTSGMAMGLSAQIEVLRDRYSLGVGVDIEAEDASITSSTRGMGFTSTMSNGMENIYLGDEDDAHTILSQYRMEGKFWGEIVTETAPDGSKYQYVYVGYTVTDYASAPALGTVAPDVYIPDGTDEDDPYNPTSDSLCLLVTTPDVVGRDDLASEKYSIQISWHGLWYDINSTTLGVRAYMQDGDEWIEQDCVYFSSGESEQRWFRITGLDSIGYYQFDFRLASVSDDGFNCTLPVTGYTDIRTLVDEVKTIDPITVVDGKAIVEASHFIDGKRAALMVYVGTDHPSMMDLVAVDTDGNTYTVAERLAVAHGGYIVYITDGFVMPGDGDDSALIWAVVAIIVLILAAGVMPKKD